MKTENIINHAMQCTMHLNGVNQEENNRGVVFFLNCTQFWMDGRLKLVSQIVAQAINHTPKI